MLVGHARRRSSASWEGSERGQLGIGRHQAGRSCGGPFEQDFVGDGLTGTQIGSVLGRGHDVVRGERALSRQAFRLAQTDRVAMPRSRACGTVALLSRKRTKLNLVVASASPPDERDGRITKEAPADRSTRAAATPLGEATSPEARRGRPLREAAAIRRGGGA